MAGQPSNLTVSLSPHAIRDLDEIWGWNFGKYGFDRADAYIAFLLAETANLAITYLAGKVVPKLPNLSYVVIQKRRSGHGHVAVYELIDDVIQVLHFYHTAQDWQARLAGESE
ncbi:MAG TPA: type II toxin-antitoxin system RelE/ParE family toxin [Humisphaera sp.]|nr:type II toxin-antitoxin system RelE/ParE family toxin [Humisphaera sp.]